jgi:hypothetical protein
VRIRSDVEQRYPGVELPEMEMPTEAPDPELDGRKLSPALDTGLEVQTRLDRAQQHARRRRIAGTITVIGALLLLVTGAIGWRYVSDHIAESTPLASLVAPDAPAPKAAGAPAPASAETSLAAATPIFAWYGHVKLHLPVPMKRLTEIGFHQASYAWALPMKTSMADANLSVVAVTRTTGRNRAAEPSGPDAVMTGKVLRMWRARAGRPDTAADVGAAAGTPVLSPVTGTVVRIKPYKLYGRYPDYEMHIIPDGTSGIDVVMIHLVDLTCAVGDHVIAGVTPVAHIRKLSDKFHDQLADYTKSPGDHVHIQVNNSNYRGYRGLVGAVDPNAYGDATSGD